MFEIVIIAGVALVVVGPEKFPPFAKAVFKTFRDLKTQIEETQREITKEIKPLEKELRELRKHNPEDYIDGLMSDSSSEDDVAGDPDFDSDYPYREHETTTKDTTESDANSESESAQAESNSAETPEGTETFDATAADSPPQDTIEDNADVDPDASSDGTD